MEKREKEKTEVCVGLAFCRRRKLEKKEEKTPSRGSGACDIAVEPL